MRIKKDLKKGGNMIETIISQVENINKSIKEKKYEELIQFCKELNNLIPKKENNQKYCLNHCPKCNAGEIDVEWGEGNSAHKNYWQNAVCSKCGTEFVEVYEYVFSEIDLPLS